MWRNGGWLGAVCAMFMAAPAAAADIHVTVYNVPFSVGEIRAGLCQGELGKEGCAGTNVPAVSPATEFVIPNVAPGRYALQVHHDHNGNGHMDFGFLHIPREGYGFSRDARPGFGPPDFEDAAFDVGDEDVFLELSLQHMGGTPREPVE